MQNIVVFIFYYDIIKLKFIHKIYLGKESLGK